jgi:ribose transport system ATP-binding protein
LVTAEQHPQRTRVGGDDGGWALRCHGLRKAFPGVVALKDLEFAARPARVHAILGENGAGKSTLIKGLAGSVPFDAGTVELFGEEVQIGSPRDARRLGIEVAYQEISAIPDLTVARSIWLRRGAGGRARRLSQRALRRRTLALYDRLSAPRVDPDRRIRHLSMAERQVVEVVASQATDPRVVVFDEATASLPADETRWVLELARRLADDGRLVLFISHRLPEIRQVGDEVTVLRDGRSALTAAMSDVDDDQLVEAMLGRKPQRLYPPALSRPRDVVNLRVEQLSSGNRLSDVSFELHEGEIIGVGGLEGQGQSALLYALFGLAPSRGKIFVRDQQVSIRSPRAAFSAGIGMALVPEDRRREGLIASKSVRENVALPILDQLTRRGLLSGRLEDEAVRQAVERLDVRVSSLEQPVTTLSGGNQQKVVIAKLLMLGAKILLLHDLTRGIDVGTKAQIFALLRELAAGGHSILFYSSDNQELVHMCDRVLVLSRGRVAARLEGDELTEAQILRAAFGLGRDDASPVVDALAPAEGRP